MPRLDPHRCRISIRPHVSHVNVQGSTRQIFAAVLWEEPEVRRNLMPIAHRMSCAWNVAWRLAEEGKAPLAIGYRGMTARARFIPIAFMPGPMTAGPAPARPLEIPRSVALRLTDAEVAREFAREDAR